VPQSPSGPVVLLFCVYSGKSQLRPLDDMFVIAGETNFKKKNLCAASPPLDAMLVLAVCVRSDRDVVMPVPTFAGSQNYNSLNPKL
jgi:hypothetical protein